jgi:hypothetical protein
MSSRVISKMAGVAEGGLAAGAIGVAGRMVVAGMEVVASTGGGMGTATVGVEGMGGEDVVLPQAATIPTTKTRHAAERLMGLPFRTR